MITLKVNEFDYCSEVCGIIVTQYSYTQPMHKASANGIVVVSAVGNDG